MNINCPKCTNKLQKNIQSTPKLEQQKKLFPQFNWISYICKCGYETVRSNGSK